ncbi:MAG: MBL fold metallo-hydrolase [Ignavibacteriaceae bacterium]|nr:MBL fold metallo-hydrolase [Ignavibacteriaceae bacterium]HRI45607.1 MBL fold metallo-hydrolase [Ignavibacteriaceae bacterium]
MKVRFWGVRGSIPTPPTSEQIRQKVLRMLEKAAVRDISSQAKREAFINEFEDWEVGLIGGNTSCVEISTKDTLLIFDMGSGMKRLGDYLIKKHSSEGKIKAHIFINHTHWDHMQGFPFFVPAYGPNSELHFYAVHENIEKRINDQQDFRFFPVGLDIMLSKKYFHQIEHKSNVQIDDFTITNLELHHPGKSYAYKVTHNGKSAIYATDAEYNNLSKERMLGYIDFYQNADLLIFDAQYSFIEEIQKVDWGHSSALVGVDIAIKANVKRLGLFHHAPENDDFEIHKLLSIAQEYRKNNYPGNQLEIFIASEGLEIHL